MMAEDLKRNNGFIPGVKPERKRAEYIDTIISRITLPGSVFLAIVAHPARLCGTDGDQLTICPVLRWHRRCWILVGVVLDTCNR